MQDKEKQQEIVLYSYFRSSSSWRLRTILNLKNIPYTQIPIHLLKKEQTSPEYLKVNPAGLIPALKIDGTLLTESMAIAEYLEERFPEKEPRLLPKDLIARANVRKICEHVNAGMQPLQNLRVLLHVIDKFQGDKIEWAKKWNVVGFESLDKILEKTMGKHCVGDELSWADVFIVPQFRNACARFGLKEDDYPNVKKVYHAVKDHPAFVKAYPENQPDAQ